MHFIASASRARVAAEFPRLPMVERLQLVATIRAVPVPDMGRFIGSAARSTGAQRATAGLERGLHDCTLRGRQAAAEQKRTVAVVIAAGVAPIVARRPSS
jgi:hypothetical protein